MLALLVEYIFLTTFYGLYGFTPYFDSQITLWGGGHTQRSNSPKVGLVIVQNKGIVWLITQ